MKVENINDEGLVRLCTGIAKKAVEDYRDYASEYYALKTRYNENRSRCGFLRGQMDLIERFFKSPYGNMICFNCGEYILQRIKSDIEHQNNK